VTPSHLKRPIRTAATRAGSISRLVTLRNEKESIRAVLHRASRRLTSIDRRRHHEHRRVIVNIAEQNSFGRPCPMSYIHLE